MQQRIVFLVYWILILINAHGIRIFRAENIQITVERQCLAVLLSRGSISMHSHYVIADNVILIRIDYVKHNEQQIETG